MGLPVIRIGLGKSVFHLVGMNQHAKVVARKRLSRSPMMALTAKIPHCLIGMFQLLGGRAPGANPGGRSRRTAATSG